MLNGLLLVSLCNASDKLSVVSTPTLWAVPRALLRESMASCCSLRRCSEVASDDAGGGVVLS